MAIHPSRFSSGQIWRLVKNSPSTIPTIKGSLAYTLFFVIFFIKPCQEFLAVPSVGAAAGLMIIAGFPGWSVNASLRILSFGILGVGIGGLNFFILAKLANRPVVQVLGLIKTKKIKDLNYLVFSLLSIMVSCNGVYSTIASPDHKFSSKYLGSYLQAYAWGAAIVIFVNIFVMPRTSETELRMALVNCLDRTRIFSFLMKKTQWCEISEEEYKVRDSLVQSIRADFNLLQAKLNQTFLGITYSKWSGNDYKKMVDLTKSMQQSLISTHSNLTLSDVKQTEARVLIDQIIQTGAPKYTELLRKYVYMGIAEVQKELFVGSKAAPFLREEMELLKEINAESLTKNGKNASQFSLGHRSVVDLSETESQLRDIEQNIELEIAEAPVDRINLDDLSSPACTESPSTQWNSPKFPHEFLALVYQITPPDLKGSNHSTQVNQLIRKYWNNVQKLQYDFIEKIYTSGRLYHPQEPLFMDRANASLQSGFSSFLPSNTPRNRLSGQIPTPIDHTDPLQPNLPRVSINLHGEPEGSSPTAPTHYGAPTLEIEGSTKNSISNEMDPDYLHRYLIRTYSHSFIMGLFLEELIEFREFVTLQKDGQPRKKKFHFSFWGEIRGRFRFQKRKKIGIETLESMDPDVKDVNGEMTMREALEILKGNQYKPRKKSLFERIHLFERFLRSPDSICAFKVACAITTLGLFHWCESTQEFAIKYNLNTAIITLIVSISPTLGQSWFGFLFQISGQGIGLLYGMMVLEIFKNVGGCKYNPYGIVCFMALFSVPMNYLLYATPQLFIMAVLVLNSAASLVYPIYLSQKVPFDSGPYRMGKYILALVIPIGIATFFQLFILRNPARRTLRKAVAKVMKANTAYTVILQAYVAATIPTDSRCRSSPQVIERVANDLTKREAQIQDAITALMPLIKFSGMEPAFGKPFNTMEYLKIAKVNQLILDRNRDARIVIGTSPISEIILEQFVKKVALYRAPVLSRIKTSLYLCTSTLQSKFPLPETLNSEANEQFGIDTLHDSLVLACRLAASPNGLQLVQSLELRRYWVYVSSVISVFHQLEAIQESAKNIFGTLEDETYDYYKEAI